MCASERIYDHFNGSLSPRYEARLISCVQIPINGCSGAVPMCLHLGFDGSLILRGLLQPYVRYTCVTSVPNRSIVLTTFFFILATQIKVLYHYETYYLPRR